VTAKHFRLIAACIRSVAIIESADRSTIDLLVRAFADALATQNGRFDRDRFEHACRP
jgi:hypothetical protein